MTQHAPSLPTNRAFVVQFRAEADVDREQIAGRVEHVVSGQATHFSSWQELHTFIAQLLSRFPFAHPEESE